MEKRNTDERIIGEGKCYLFMVLLVVVLMVINILLPKSGDVQYKNYQKMQVVHDDHVAKSEMIETSGIFVRGTANGAKEKKDVEK